MHSEEHQELTQNDSDLVEKLRVDFARKNKNLFQDIRRAIDTSDIKTAHLLAHTLKGTAGLIHEQVLAEAAKHVEQILASGETPTDAMLSVVERELTRVLEDIGEVEVPYSHAMLDKENAFALFDKLEPLLLSRNVECLNLIDELRQIPETAVLCRQIKEFDFRTALKVLITLRAIFEE